MGDELTFVPIELPRPCIISVFIQTRYEEMAGPDTSRSIASHRHELPVGLVATSVWNLVAFTPFCLTNFERKIHICMYIRNVMAVLAKLPNKLNSLSPFKSSFCVDG